MKFFLDTEFVARGQLLLPISIGIVSEGGDEYYVEVNSPWKQYASPWIMDNVGIHLKGRAVSPVVIEGEVKEFLTCAAVDEPLEFWAYWAAYDWVIFCEVMGGLLGLPENISPWVRDLAWLASSEEINGLGIENKKPHHALYDARQLRKQHAALEKRTRQQSKDGFFGEVLKNVLR